MKHKVIIPRVTAHASDTHVFRIGLAVTRAILLGILHVTYVSVKEFINLNPSEGVPRAALLRADGGQAPTGVCSIYTIN